MLEQIKELPEPLQKQIFIRLGFTLVFFLLFILLLALGNNLYTVLPCIGLIAFCAANAWLLFCRAIRGEYVIFTGTCSETECTVIRRRTKSIYLQTDEYIVQVMIKQRLKRIPIGSTLEIYVASNTPVYEKEGRKMLYTYLAIKNKPTKLN